MERTSATDEIAGELYLVPPSRFVAARDELVRETRAAGNRELARELKSLRRPAPSAWLVNLLARLERPSMERLFALGREMRQAQTQLDGTELRRLSAQRQQMIADLLDRARVRADEAGLQPTDAVLAEVGETLRAALVDLAASATVLAGRLVRPLSHSGFGPLPPPGTPSARPPAEGDLPDAGQDLSFWPVAVDELGQRREHAASAPPAGEREEVAEGDDVARRAAELAAAESAHWQREQDLVHAKAAVQEARDRLEGLDQQRMLARREKVTAERRLAEAQSAQRATVRAVAQARRALEAAESRQTDGRSTSATGDA